MDTLKSIVGVRRLLRVMAPVATTLTLVIVAVAAPAAAHGSGSRFPDVIALPNGFLPEGIAIGLKTDARGRLFVTAGIAGNGRVIDVKTGEILKSYPFAAAPTFVNDVVLTRSAAYFTNSRRPVLYKVAFGKRGALPVSCEKMTCPGRADPKLLRIRPTGTRR
jgi:hypothetical protein